MSKRKRRQKQGKRSPSGAAGPDAAAGGPLLVTQLLYGALALFWLYAGITTILEASTLMESGQQEAPWLVPASVALFAVGWFWFHYVNVVAARGHERLAQLLLVTFFLIFLASMIPVFLGDSELVRNGARTAISFGLTGLFLRMSTQKRQRAGFFGALFSRKSAG